MVSTPASVVGELIARVGEGRWAELAGLYAEDAVVEHPLRRTRIAGRAAIGERFVALGKVELAAFDVVLHETTDPEVVVAEFGFRGPGFTAANVQVVRVREGLIAHSRDYHDHLRMAAARGDVSGIVVPYEPTEPSPAAPRIEAEPGSRGAVVQDLLYSISSDAPASRADLYADDAFVTHPFHPTAPPLKGKDALRRHFAPGGGEGLRPRNVVLHEGVDPELVIAEFEYVGTAGPGNPVYTTNIFVLRVRDGLIVESRDYADHVAFAAATGQLPTLIAAAQSVVTPAGP